MHIMALFWECVAILELSCGLFVITCTCDGASPNRKFFQMHSVNSELCYKVVNIFSPDRFIYFFSDGCHLLKTARNSWANSGSGKCSRYMWNDGKHILWSHLSRIYYEELSVGGCKTLPKLTLNHIQLNSYSVMTVKFAAQVLSTTVSKVLSRFGGQESSETAKFCVMMDSFFDCCITRHCDEATQTRKPCLQPYTDVNDPRFDWLLETFLPYFDRWWKSIQYRHGDFSDSERERMFIPKQTHQGLFITCHSLVEAIRFLLRAGMTFVFSERLLQDILEEYFGHQRMLGCRTDNPTVHQFGYNANALRIQKDVSRISGNTRGRFDDTKACHNVSAEPADKRRAKRKK